MLPTAFRLQVSTEDHECWACCVQWDLSFRNLRMERRFTERFARRLVLVDSAHCALLLLVALYGFAQAVLPGSHHAQTAPLLASGVPQYPFRAQPRMWVFMSCMLREQECHFGPLVYLNAAPAPSSATQADFCIAAGFVAVTAAVQLVALQSFSAGWQHREQLASAERLILPALSLFYCLSEVRLLPTASCGCSPTRSVLRCLHYIACEGGC